jgi:hypothetical protein
MTVTRLSSFKWLIVQFKGGSFRRTSGGNYLE